MRRSVRDTRRRILESAYRLFYGQGFGRVGVDAVAEAAGVTKRTLYNHFASKDDLVAAVLEAQGDMASAEIARWCDDEPETPEALVATVFARLRTWADMPGWRGSGFTRAVMEFAWAPGHPARRAASAQKAAVEERLARAFRAAGAAEPERFARELLLLQEGAMALRMIHRDAAWLDDAEVAALRLVRAAGPRAGADLGGDAVGDA